MEELKTCPLIEYLKQHRKDCAKDAKLFNFWFSSEIEDSIALTEELE